MRSVCNGPWPALLAALVCLSTADGGAAAQSKPGASSSKPFAIQQIAEVGVDAVLGRIIDAALDSSGGVWVADLSVNQVVHFDSLGTETGRVGGKGGGPGEFQMLYRVATGPAGELYALDLATSELSLFDAYGRYQRRWRLPLFLGQVDRIVVLPDFRIVIAGISDDSGARGHGLHLLDSSQHLQSFGPVPAARNPNVLRYWGAGNLSLASDTTLLFALRVPNIIYRYAPDGSLRDSIAGTVKLSLQADDAISLSQDAERTTVGTTDTYVPRPIFALQVKKGLVLAGRTVAREAPLVFDLYRADGSLLTSTKVSPQIRGILGFDLERGILWGMGVNQKDEPVLLRMSIAMSDTLPR